MLKLLMLRFVFYSSLHIQIKNINRQLSHNHGHWTAQGQPEWEAKLRG